MLEFFYFNDTKPLFFSVNEYVDLNLSVHTAHNFLGFASAFIGKNKKYLYLKEIPPFRASNKLYLYLLTVYYQQVSFTQGTQRSSTADGA